MLYLENNAQSQYSEVRRTHVPVAEFDLSFKIQYSGSHWKGNLLELKMVKLWESLQFHFYYFWVGETPPLFVPEVSQAKRNAEAVISPWRETDARLVLTVNPESDSFYCHHSAPGARNRMAKDSGYSRERRADGILFPIRAQIAKLTKPESF